MADDRGVVLEAGQELLFVPVDEVERVAQATAIARVGGMVPPALGIGLVEGRALPIVAIGGGTLAGVDEVLVCRVAGDAFAIAGGRVRATGAFESVPGGVRWAGRVARRLDVGALYAQTEAAVWNARAERGRARAKA